MKKLYSYILKSYIGPFIATFFIALFILLMQFLWKYVDDMVGKGFDWYVIARLLFYASSTFVPLALPLAVLLSSLMTFGNLGERYELVALKAAGISIRTVMKPMIGFIILLSFTAFLFSNNVMPVANLNMRLLLHDVRKQKPTVSIQPGIFYDEIENYTIKINKRHNDGKTIEDIIIYDHSGQQGNVSVTVADSGTMQVTKDQRYLIFKLYNGANYYERIETREDKQSRPLQLTRFGEQLRRIDLSSFSFEQTNEDFYKNHYQMMNIHQLQFSRDSLLNDAQERKEKLQTKHWDQFRYYSSINKEGYPVSPDTMRTSGDSSEDSAVSSGGSVSRSEDTASSFASGSVSRSGDTASSFAGGRERPQDKAVDGGKSGRHTTGDTGKTGFDSAKARSTASGEITYSNVSHIFAAMHSEQQKQEPEMPVSRRGKPDAPGEEKQGGQKNKTLRGKGEKAESGTRREGKSSEDLPQGSEKPNIHGLTVEELRSVAARRGLDLDSLIAHDPSFPTLISNDSRINPDLMKNFKPAEQRKITNFAINSLRNTINTITFTNTVLERRQELIARHQIEWHRKFTLSFACIVLFFIGAPLGTIIRKGGFGFPVVVSVLLFVVYHVVSMTGEKFARELVISPWLGMWLSAFLLLPVGVFLTLKATTDAPILNVETYRRFFKNIMNTLLKKK
ncbi:MAG: LptF/LptG family permease [Bacteroidales bacterium]